MTHLTKVYCGSFVHCVCYYFKWFKWMCGFLAIDSTAFNLGSNPQPMSWIYIPRVPDRGKMNGWVLSLSR